MTDKNLFTADSTADVVPEGDAERQAVDSMVLPRLYRRRAARLRRRPRLAEDTARRLRDQGHRRAVLEVYENDVAAGLETLIE